MIRFSTVAANADVLGDDTPMAEPRAPMDPPERGSRGTARERRRLRREQEGGAESGAAKPGEDINAPGFLKDSDPDTRG